MTIPLVQVVNRFSPSDIAGMAAWFDAGFGVTSSAGAVSAWADRSGQIAAAAQGTGANKPTIVTNALNGLPALAFTGAQFLSLTLNIQPPFTIAFVAFTNAVDAAYHGVATFSGSTGAAVFARSSSAQTWGVYANADASSGAALTTFKRCIAVGRAYNDIDFRTNGASVTVATGVSGFATASVIGSLQSGGVQCLEGQIAEIIPYRAALSVSDCQKLEAYFASKYAL